MKYILVSTQEIVAARIQVLLHEARGLATPDALKKLAATGIPGRARRLMMLAPRLLRLLAPQQPARR